MVIFYYQFQYYDVAYFLGCNYHCHDKCERMVSISLIYKDEFSPIHCTVCKVLRRSPQVFRDSCCPLVALHLLHITAILCTCNISSVNI